MIRTVLWAGLTRKVELNVVWDVQARVLIKHRLFQSNQIKYIPRSRVASHLSYLINRVFSHPCELNQADEQYGGIQRWCEDLHLSHQ